MYRNDEKCSTKACGVVSDYTQNSNLHGMVYIGDRKRHWIERYLLVKVIKENAEKSLN